MTVKRTRRGRPRKIEEKPLVQQVIDNHTKPLQPRPQVELITTGSTMLDLSLGNGYGWGTMVNVIGDTGSGKSGLVIETIANAYHKLKDRLIIDYAEPEARLNIDTQTIYNFDIYPYVYRPESIQKYCYHLNQKLDRLKDNQYLISVVDSFDALTSDEEIERFNKEQEIFDKDKNRKSKGTYGAERAKFSSYLFRSIIRKVERKNCLLIIISQIRDKIGVTFGRKWMRVGGKALDFYASQIVVLAEVSSQKIYKNISFKDKGKSSGILIKSYAEKNSINKPFRTAFIEYLFNYGISDTASCIDFYFDLRTPTGELKGKKEKLLWNSEEYKRKELIYYIDNNKSERDKLVKLVKDKNEKEEIESDCSIGLRNKF